MGAGVWAHATDRPLPAEPHSDVFERGCRLGGLGTGLCQPGRLGGLASLCTAFAVIVRWEERQSLDRLGEDYRAYLADVPRWLPGTSRRRRTPAVAAAAARRQARLKPQRGRIFTN